MVVNHWLDYNAGKIIFILVDVITGILMWRILETQNVNKKYLVFYAGYHILNPVCIILCTRGSNDNIIVLLVMLTIYFMLKRQYVLSAFFYGFSVHFKIYPIIYSLPFYLYIDSDKKAILGGKTSTMNLIFNNFFTRNRIVFTIVSASTFLFFTWLFYYIYGYECLYESLLYHLERKDNRHNFSVYWMFIYQTYDSKASVIMSILTFVPQMSVVFLSGLLLWQDLFLAITVQTWAFVTFNKVVTC